MKRKARYFIYGNGGSIWETKNRLDAGKEDRYNSLYDVLCVLGERHAIGNINAFDTEDLTIRYYGTDSRIDKDVYIICTKRYFREKYDTPQFVSFLVEV